MMQAARLLFIASIFLSAGFARAQTQLETWYMGEIKVELEGLKQLSSDKKAGKICVKNAGLECFKEAYAKYSPRSSSALASWLNYSLALCQERGAKKIDVERVFPCLAWLWKNLDTKKFHLFSLPDFATPEGKEKLFALEREFLPKTRDQAEKALQKSIDATKSPMERSDRVRQLKELKAIEWRL